ncbi:MAG TPA: hypothetical protein VHY48_01055 [Acidobacteriaceae bacterium]|jgi:hypothetical protein|nr:hypothetical protein [Acidobacteriaceae bacterium]
MRLPFPTRISVEKTLIFAAAVLGAQLLEGTNLLFGVLFFAFIMLSVLAFNLAGGFSRASGTYVFSFALLTCVVGGLWKIVLAEPADSNLSSPEVTMLTYVVSMVGIMTSLFISHRITRKSRGFLDVIGIDKVNLGLASLGCFIGNVLTVPANILLPGGNGSLISIINQENVLFPLAILLGTVHTIRISGGRRSVNVVTFVSAVLMFVVGGLINYSKQGMFTPIVCWGIAAASQRYRLRSWQILLLVAFAVYSVTILSPLSQVGRQLGSEDTSGWERLQLSIDLLSHPKRLRAEYINAIEPAGSVGPGESVANFAKGYFNSPQGLLDRMTIIQMDDRLITYTLQGHTDGYQRYIYYFINWIPHFILPNKESLAPPGAAAGGNYYAHEIGGILSPDDFTTGISFSPSAEAFHMEEWVGLLFLAPLVWTLLFTTVDLICGDLRRSPFGLIAAVAFAHLAPESLLGGLIQFVWAGNLAIVGATIFCLYFAPVLGALLAGEAPTQPAFSVSTASIRTI